MQPCFHYFFLTQGQAGGDSRLRGLGSKPTWLQVPLQVWGAEQI